MQMTADDLGVEGDGSRFAVDDTRHRSRAASWEFRQRQKGEVANYEFVRFENDQAAEHGA